MGNIGFFLEFLVFSGAALAWAGWEWWSVRKAGNEPAKSDARHLVSPSAEASRHPEG
jgi:hypothetical protein